MSPWLSPLSESAKKIMYLINNQKNIKRRKGLCSDVSALKRLHTLKTAEK